MRCPRRDTDDFPFKLTFTLLNHEKSSQLVTVCGKVSLRAIFRNGTRYSQVPGVLLGSPREPVLVHLPLSGDSTVGLRVESRRDAVPIIRRLLGAAPHFESIALLGFCHLISIYLC